jgi:hypothetical protein
VRWSTGIDIYDTQMRQALDAAKGWAEVLTVDADQPAEAVTDEILERPRDCAGIRDQGRSRRPYRRAIRKRGIPYHYASGHMV